MDEEETTRFREQSRPGECTGCKSICQQCELLIKCSYEELEEDVKMLHNCNYEDGERIEELEFTIEDLEEQLEKLKEILKVKGCEYQKN